MEEILIDEKKKNKARILFALLKFGSKTHLEKLRKKGTLYLRPLEKLRSDNNHREDSYEGAYFVQGFHGGGMLEGKIPGGDSFKVNFISGSLKHSYGVVLGNICSFYAISSDCFVDRKYVPVDERMKEFGQHYLFITDTTKFFHLLRDKIEELKTNCMHGFVDYYNEEYYQGKVNLFQKRIRYEYQREYRIYIPSNRSKKALKISLGSLEDISLIGDSGTIDKLIFTPISQ